MFFFSFLSTNQLEGVERTYFVLPLSVTPGSIFHVQLWGDKYHSFFFCLFVWRFNLFLPVCGCRCCRLSLLFFFVLFSKMFIVLALPLAHHQRTLSVSVRERSSVQGGQDVIAEVITRASKPPSPPPAPAQRHRQGIACWECICPFTWWFRRA